MSALLDPPATLQSRVWTTVLSLVLFIGMLAAFHRVVQDAVEQAALRHKANALVAEATWRCNSAPPPAATSCTAKHPMASSLSAVYVADAQFH